MNVDGAQETLSHARTRCIEAETAYKAAHYAVAFMNAHGTVGQHRTAQQTLRAARAEMWRAEDARDRAEENLIRSMAADGDPTALKALGGTQ